MSMRTFKEDAENLRTVLRKLIKHGVKLTPCKCSSFKREVKLLERELCQVMVSGWTQVGKGHR